MDEKQSVMVEKLRVKEAFDNAEMDKKWAALTKRLAVEIK